MVAVSLGALLARRFKSIDRKTDHGVETGLRIMEAGVNIAVPSVTIFFPATKRSIP
jgi:hypothetical protein